MARKKKQEEDDPRSAYQPQPPSLEELRAREVYSDEDEYPSLANIRLTRRIIRELIDTLIALGPDGDEAEKMDAFRRAVERFNDTEDSDDPFIETVEREYLCELLGDIGDAAGLTDYDVSAWRDW